MAQEMSGAPSPDQVAGNGSALAAAGRADIEALRTQSPDCVPTLAVAACLGLGRA